MRLSIKGWLHPTQQLLAFTAANAGNPPLVLSDTNGPKWPFIHWRVPHRSFPKKVARIEMQRPGPPRAFYPNMPAKE
jgi:hypothetical protein